MRLCQAGVRPAGQLQVPPLDFGLLQQATVLEACQAEHGGQVGGGAGGGEDDDQAAMFGVAEVQRTEATKLPCLLLADLRGREVGGGGGGGVGGGAGGQEQQIWAMLFRFFPAQRIMQHDVGVECNQ